MRYERYAIYWAPDPGDALDRFAAAWFAAPDPLTELPARYGLHGTLRAPFRPAKGVGRDAIEAAVAALAKQAAPVACAPLALHRDEAAQFFSLRPSRPCAALGDLAGAIVRGTNALRAPLSEAELARRRRAGLTPEQEARLAAWGYPYVFEDFHFHITLSGPVAAADAKAAEARISAALPPLEGPFRIERIWLFGDPGGGERFERLAGFDLSGP